jgi:hypothetical protein
MTIRVKYLTVTVYEDSLKIERDGQLIEIVAKIYTMKVNAYKSTERGDVPLENARIHFEKDGEEIVAGDIRDGVFPVQAARLELQCLGRVPGSKRWVRRWFNTTGPRK